MSDGVERERSASRRPSLDSRRVGRYWGAWPSLRVGVWARVVEGRIEAAG